MHITCTYVDVCTRVDMCVCGMHAYVQALFKLKKKNILVERFTSLKWPLCSFVFTRVDLSHFIRQLFFFFFSDCTQRVS